METKFKDIRRVDNIEGFIQALEQDQLPFLNEAIPLFHYTSAPALMGIIENEELWLTKSELLNDKLELKYTLDLVLSLIEEFLGDQEVEEEQLFKEWIKKSIESKFFSAEIYTLSLSTNGDSNLLWSNYANNDGYNIEFRYPEIVEVLIKNIGKLHPDKGVGVFPYFVIYNLDQQVMLLKKEIINLYKIFLYALDQGDETLCFKYGGKVLANIVMYSIFFKDNSFSQEEEFRIAVYFPDKIYGQSTSKCRLSNGVFIPFIALPISTEEKQLLIKEITIGPKNSLDIAEQGLRHFLDINQLPAATINKSKIPYRY